MDRSKAKLYPFMVVGATSLLGCSHSSSNMTDGGSVERGPVTVTVTTVPTLDHAGSAVAGVPVVFYDPDGVASPAVFTDELGTATATIAAHSAVTIATPAALLTGSPGLTTFLDIAPGDTLTAYAVKEGGGQHQVDVTAAYPGGSAGSAMMTSWELSSADQRSPGSGSSVAAGFQLAPGTSSLNLVAASPSGNDGAFGVTAYASAQGVPIAHGSASVTDWTWTAATPS